MGEVDGKLTWKFDFGKTHMYYYYNNDSLVPEWSGWFLDFDCYSKAGSCGSHYNIKDHTKEEFINSAVEWLQIKMKDLKELQEKPPFSKKVKEVLNCKRTSKKVERIVNSLMNPYNDEVLSRTGTLEFTNNRLKALKGVKFEKVSLGSTYQLDNISRKEGYMLLDNNGSVDLYFDFF